MIQFNGKKKGNLVTEIDIDEKKLINKIKSDPKLNRNLINKKIEKYFFVKNRLINILVK